MRSEHFYTCMGCGKRGTCGDCIPLFCGTCKDLQRNHPSTETLESGNGCPCSFCQSAALDKEIRRKLIAGGMTEAEIDALHKAANQESTR